MTLSEFFKKEKIEYYVACPISEVRVINRDKLRRATEGLEPDTAVCFIVSYYCGKESVGNISRYAMARDYHIYFRELFSRLREECDLKFAGFSDNSPIAEVELAARLGLGVVGRNRLLINEKYGSFVFIGELLTEGDAGLGTVKVGDVRCCPGCGVCEECCPTRALVGDMSVCLSNISQKKHISPEEEEILRKNGCLWGCDVCQEVCPMNADAAVTPIEFFSENLVRYLDREVLGERAEFDKLSDRAFSWRGYDVLKRNLDILEK